MNFSTSPLVQSRTSWSTGERYQLSHQVMSRLKALLDFLPCAVFVRVNFAFAVLRAAALAVNQALGAVHDGADAAGDVQVALSAGVAGLLRQCHAVMTLVVQGIAGRENGKLYGIGDSLDTQTAGDNKDVLRSFGDGILQLFEGLRLVAEKINLQSTGNLLTLLYGDLHELIAVRLVDGFKFLETLVAGYDENVVQVGQQRNKFVSPLQFVLGIVLQIFLPSSMNCLAEARSEQTKTIPVSALSGNRSRLLRLPCHSF